MHFRFLLIVLSFIVAQRGCCGYAHATGRRLGSAKGTRRVQPVSMTAAATGKVKRGGDATVASSTFNLAKSIVGAGVLSLPSGIAFFADSPAAIVPASVMCAVMGLVSAYTFSLIGRVCEKTNATSFQDAWSKTVNPKTAWTISAMITAMCFLASLAYSIIIGDSFTSLAQTFNFPAFFASRTNVIIAMTTCVLFPLCSLKSLNALSPFSLLGLGGTLYTAIFMAIRFLDGSYKAGGKFFVQLAPALRPVFNKRPLAVNHLVFVLISMLSTSYIAHYNAPSFYNELKDTSMPRFNKVIGLAFGASIATFVIMMNLGFLTFGGATAGYVLNNYASADGLASLARLAIGLALLTGYPFTFSALRDGILDLRKLEGAERAKQVRPLTIGLITAITALAISLKNVGYVLSLSGALFGSTLMFCVPAYMNICAERTKGKAFPGKEPSNNSKLEVAVNWGMIATGFIMGAIGVTVSTLQELGKL